MEDAGYTSIEERDVVVVSPEDRPGALGETARRIAVAGVNIELAYLATNTRWSSAPPTSTRCRLVRPQAAARAEFGHLFETFVVGELLKQASWLDGVAGWGHWRTHDGDEVDLVVEGDDGRVVAFEVKAASRVSTEELRGLRKLRAALGDRFLRGVVITAGAHCYAAEDRV